MEDIKRFETQTLKIMELVNNLDSSFNESNEDNAAELIAKIKIDFTKLAKDFKTIVVGKEFTKVTNPVVEAFVLKTNAFNKYKGEK